MDVNVQGMCRVLLIVAVAACSSDPTLHVTVTHPADSQVVKTVVSVYEGAFGCVDGRPTTVSVNDPASDAE